jgi:hypothetical protein
MCDPVTIGTIVASTAASYAVSNTAAQEAKNQAPDFSSSIPKTAPAPVLGSPTQTDALSRQRKLRTQLRRGFISTLRTGAGGALGPAETIKQSLTPTPVGAGKTLLGQ